MRGGGRKRAAGSAGHGAAAEDEGGVAEEVRAEATGGDEQKPEEVEEQEEEDEEAEGEGEGAPAPAPAAEGPTKLDDGFYEIEGIRKKRVRKGQLQYLIKWRGWPESANTWEPIDNLQSCADIIEAFEERSRSPKGSRRRKRKHGGTPHAVGRKKRSGQAEESENPSPAGRSDDTDKTAGEAEADGEGKGERADDEAGGEGKEDGDAKKTTMAEAEANGSLHGVGDGQKKNESTNGVPGSAEQKEQRGSMGGKAECLSVSLPGQREEDGSIDGFSKVESTQPSQGGHVSGARKRKSGSVRRFKQDSTPRDQEEAQNAAARSGNGSFSKFEKPGNEDVDSTEDNIGDKNKSDDSAKPFPITKILKPVRYFASVKNNVQEVSITFKALRSDGKEVLVDDKELKLNNPLLLISFYEQHLRYSPQS